MIAKPKTLHLSHAKSVGFRPGAPLRAELEKFREELAGLNPTLTFSDILRDGFTFYWPHIRAFLVARAKHPEVPPEDLQRIVFAALRAHGRGLTPREISQSLKRAVVAKGPRDGRLK